MKLEDIEDFNKYLSKLEYYGIDTPEKFYSFGLHEPNIIISLLDINENILFELMERCKKIIEPSLIKDLDRAKGADHPLGLIINNSQDVDNNSKDG